MLWMANPTPQRSLRPTPLCNWLASRIPVRRSRRSFVASISLLAAAPIEAANGAGVGHFVYVSVAHPAPMMKTYIEVRSQCEAMIGESGMRATILRPWYVLGPGHRWPYFLIPIYKLMELLPSTREGATRLGLVTLAQMVRALVEAVETPSHGVRVVEVPEIRSAGTSSIHRAAAE